MKNPLIYCIVSSALFSVTFAVAAERPNVILIMGDDIGFSDLGCFGSEIETPNLDRLADGGLRFSQFYNMSKCNPTRSSMWTGMYYGNKQCTLLGQEMQRAGYRTMMTGKEHYDRWIPKEARLPAGYDRSFYYPLISSYFLPSSGKFENTFHLDGKPLSADQIEAERKPLFKTDFVTDYALRFLDEAATKDDQPFFLYVAYNAAHYPLQARPEDIARYRGKYRKGWDKIREERFERIKELGLISEDVKLRPPEGIINRFRGLAKDHLEIRTKIPLYRPWDSLSDKEQDELDLEMAVFAAMVHCMDRNIGRVMDRLEKHGLTENTLVMYLSDNGSCPYDSNRNFDMPPGPRDSYRTLCAAWANAGNTPFRYFKQYGHEGGGHTHFIARWPEVIAARGGITPQPAHLVDIMPTLLELARADMSRYRFHGQSLSPIFEGKKRAQSEYILSGLEKFRMFRQGDWKLVRVNGEAWELYDLSVDPTELNNVALEHPERLERMIEAYTLAKDSMKNESNLAHE